AELRAARLEGAQRGLPEQRGVLAHTEAARTAPEVGDGEVTQHGVAGQALEEAGGPGRARRLASAQELHAPGQTPAPRGAQDRTHQGTAAERESAGREVGGQAAERTSHPPAPERPLPRRRADRKS